MRDARDSDKGSGDRKSALVKDVARRLFSTGAEAVQLTEEGLRSLVGEVGARETLREVIEQVTKGTDTLQSILAGEARKYLDTINFRDEVGKVLANYSIEVNARINFVPKEKGSEKKRGKKDSDAARLETEKMAIKFVSKEDEDGDKGERG